ncbi:MAG: hypothetical protein ACREXW_05100 [Gammaproteobacteria bacterium]
MIAVNGVSYKTITDAAKEFGVSPKTVGDWIDKEIIPKPPVLEYGIRTIQYFTEAYLEKAKLQLKGQVSALVEHFFDIGVAKFQR